jgi:predicted O-methyltransferase YrrM
MLKWMDIPGWLTEEEGNELARLATGRLVLEIGSYCGRSTVAMAATAKVIVSIDPHDSSTTEPHPPIQTLDIFQRNIAGLPVIPFLGRIEQFEPYLVPNSFDMVFVDADHSYDACLRDIAAAERVVRDGGVIAVHDYGMWRDAHLLGVTRAVDKVWTTFSVVGSLAVRTVG